MAKEEEEKEFNVSLEITLSAKNPLDAAKQLEKMLIEQAKGWQYYVQEENDVAGEPNNIFSVDLDEPDEEAVLPVTDYQPNIKY